MGAQSLNKAKRRRDDEFFTPMPVVKDYCDRLLPTGALVGAHVHLPADGIDSAFTRYFVARFDDLGLRKLTALCYSPQARLPLDCMSARKPAQLFTWTADGRQVEPIKGTGAWQSALGRQLLLQADFICTNPPFSGLVTLVKYLLSLSADFALLVPLTLLDDNGIWQHIRDRRLLACSNRRGGMSIDFARPSGETKDICCAWLSTRHNVYPKLSWNLDKRWRDSMAADYPFCDSPYSNVRFVARCSDIPLGYVGQLAVPITYLLAPDKRFDIMAVINHPFVAGKARFTRVVIQQRQGG